jgi:hypothetical protein
VRGRLDLLRRLSGEPAAGEPDPADTEAFLAAGDLATRRGAKEAAAALYRQAAVADPKSSAARERLDGPPALAPPTTVGARFDNGIELVSCRLDRRESRPGEAVELRLVWRIPENLARIDRLSVWVHAVDPGGRTVFQGDHALLEDLRVEADAGREEPCSHRLAIPLLTPPGDYELRAGLWTPIRETRVDLVEAGRPHDRHGAAVGTLTVTAAQGEPTARAR